MNDPIEPLLERMRGMRVRTHQKHDSVIREAMSRIEVGRHLAGLLEDALFYARSYADLDPTGEGKRRREEKEWEFAIEQARQRVREWNKLTEELKLNETMKGLVYE